MLSVDVIGKDLLEIRSPWSMCSTHLDETKKFIGLTDIALVCGSCVIFGEHEGRCSLPFRLSWLG